MARYVGHVCDGCKAVIPQGERTRAVLKFDGPAVVAEFHLDLCRPCTEGKIPPGVKKRPLRRRATV